MREDKTGREIEALRERVRQANIQIEELAAQNGIYRGMIDANTQVLELMEDAVRGKEAAVWQLTADGDCGL